MMDYFAHSIADAPSGHYTGWQLLRDHLTAVATLSQRHATDACPNDPAFVAAARWAGLLHDLGKYRPEFQAMIRSLKPKSEATRHKQAGAAHAALHNHPHLAFAIAGHHGGLPDHTTLKEMIHPNTPGGLDVAKHVWPLALQDTPALAAPMPVPLPIPSKLDLELLTRLLFSCLVDADWLDTAEHHRLSHYLLKNQPAPSLPPPPLLAPADRLNQLLANIKKRADKCAPAIAAIRDDILQASLAAAALPPGLFSMTVPTGGGKTLSALAFALQHAATYSLRRIIYVAPYLSIIEQNARAIRLSLNLPPDSPILLEHHSLAEPLPTPQQKEKELPDPADLLAENWDAPLVLTTSVQFYESLFANAPRRCRKLHNLARSVILLDECQTLPPGLIAPTAHMLQSFAALTGSSIVLCTATQPAWNYHPALLPEGLTNVREIIPLHLDLFTKLRRVHVTWPDLDSPWDYPRIAAEMAAEPRRQALCVVNSKRAARSIFQQLQLLHLPNVFHLSTAMCPAHRLSTLDTIRTLLTEKSPVYLVSTQLIEAGVDIDFPLLLRELAPLEAIVQAAGRCNREGTLPPTPTGLPGGRVLVFRPAEEHLPPDTWYRNGIDTLTHSFLRNDTPPDISRPADLQNYFHRLYHTGSLDQPAIQAKRQSLQFEAVADAYRLIDSATTSVIPENYAPAKDEILALLADLRKSPTSALYRKLTRFQINLFDCDRRLLEPTILKNHAPGIDLCTAPYDPHLGLIPSGPLPILYF